MHRRCWCCCCCQFCCCLEVKARQAIFSVSPLMIIMTFGIMMKIIIGIITSIATASVTSKSAKVIVNNSSNNNNSRDRIETKLNANESHPRKKILRMQHFKYKKNSFPIVVVKVVRCCCCRHPYSDCQCRRHSYFLPNISTTVFQRREWR